MKDKNFASMLGELAPLGDEILLTRPQISRSADPQDLLPFAGHGNITESISDALLTAKEIAHDDDVIVVTAPSTLLERRETSLSNSSRILCLLLLLSMPFYSYGQQPRSFTASGPVDISAERLEYNKKENTYTATGKVELKEGTRTLTQTSSPMTKTVRTCWQRGMSCSRTAKMSCDRNA